MVEVYWYTGCTRCCSGLIQLRHVSSMWCQMETTRWYMYWQSDFTSFKLTSSSVHGDWLAAVVCILRSCRSIFHCAVCRQQVHHHITWVRRFLGHSDIGLAIILWRTHWVGRCRRWPFPRTSCSNRQKTSSLSTCFSSVASEASQVSWVWDPSCFRT